MVKEGRPETNKENERKQLAAAFAQQFSMDHGSINDQHFNILQEEFTEKAISEWCAFISFITASQQLGKIYNLGEDQANKVTTLKELGIK